MSTPLPVSTSSARSPAPLSIDPRAYQRGLSCVHCGLCLPACPTYATNGLEADSPRGRIQLMLGLAEGKIEPTPSVRQHLDLCLDCRGCETACPSGVVYHELLEGTRAALAPTQPLTAQGRLMRWLFFHVFTRASRLKLALLPPRLMQKAGLYRLLRASGIFNILPIQLRKMEQMLPAEGRIWPKKLPVRTPAARADARKLTVGFLSGCIGSVMFDEVNRKAVQLLAACGADVIVPAAQGCCGAIHLHNARHDAAAEMARRNIDQFLPIGQRGVDQIATTISGCGAMLREYDALLRDDPEYADRARLFASKVRDVTEVLLELGLPPMPHAAPQSATYHDACHLAHAQKVTAVPRALLAQVPGLTLIPLPESDMCCGAAGTYNLTQPEMSAKLAERKLRNIAATGASLCITGNVGCALQIQSQAAATALPLHVAHPVEILHRAVFGA